MTSAQKLSFFHELINCNYPLFSWEYDRDFNLIHTDYAGTLFSDGFLVYTGLSKIIHDYLKEGKQMPVVLEIPGNLLWICGFEQNSLPSFHIHLIGPIFNGRDSLMVVKRRLDSHNLSVKTRAAVMKNFESIPALPLNIINQYAVMLHYCLNQEKTDLGNIEYLYTENNSQKEPYPPTSHKHDGIWYAEQQLFKMIAEGDPRYKEALSKSFSLSSGIKAELGDSLRSMKNNSLVLLTLCSRACISGGLLPSVAYDLNDYYAYKIEECTSLAAVSAICNEMLDDYVTHVQESKQQTHISAPIQNSCNYIKTHISSPLSIAELAGRVGYTEYYFSHKFKAEVGCSINDFILKEKIEQAKLLLSGTTDSIQSISERLSFGNRSYFSTCFQKLTGISPSEYRKENGKL